jgi:hypothetical protein
MKYFIITLICISNLALAYPSYTAYSGAPGGKGYCASQCHGGGTGTIVVLGVPANYEPLKTYTIIVKRRSGNVISNFNGSTRKGSTTMVAGSFAVGYRTALYIVPGYENVVRASVNSVDSITFLWTAPAAGTGEVKFYVAGLQGSKSGPTTKITISSLELVSDVEDNIMNLSDFVLNQNYPNPFNPATKINFSAGKSANTTLKLYDILGNEIAVLFSAPTDADRNYVVDLNGNNLSNGTYFYRLQSGAMSSTRKLILMK